MYYNYLCLLLRFAIDYLFLFTLFLMILFKVHVFLTFLNFILLFFNLLVGLNISLHYFFVIVRYIVVVI